MPADDGLDLERVAAIGSYRHQIVPLVVAAFRGSGRAIPAPIAARYDPVGPYLAAREAVRLCALLEAGGIEPLFLKGSTLAMLAYGALDRRRFGDIDILVRPDEASRAAALLSDAGYRADGCLPDALPDRVARLLPLAKDIALDHVASGHVVELHWRMTDTIGERPPRDIEEVEQVDLAPGLALPTLGSEALFPYLCGHGAAHLWARLRWLADIAALLARAPDGGEQLWRDARVRGQGRATASAILLATRFFGVPVPASFPTPASIRLRLLVWASCRVIEAGGGATDLAETRWRGWAEMAAKLLLASRTGDAAGWTMKLLFSVADGDEPDGSRLWYVRHSLLRIPRLIQRRRKRRAVGQRAA